MITDHRTLLPPATRAECPARPCDRMWCRHSLIRLKLDVIRPIVRFPSYTQRVDEVIVPSETCALDLADEPQSLVAIAELMGVTKQAIEQTVMKVTAKVRKRAVASGLEDWVS